MRLDARGEGCEVSRGRCGEQVCHLSEQLFFFKRASVHGREGLSPFSRRSAWLGTASAGSSSLRCVCF